MLTKIDALTRLVTIRRVYRPVCARLVIGLAGVWFGVVAGGCGAPGVRASAGRDGLGAVASAALMDLGGGARLRRVVDPATGDALGTVRTESSFDEGVAGGPGRWTVRTTETGMDGSVSPERSAGHVVGPYGGVYLSWSRSVKDTDPDGPARLYVFEPALIWFPAAIEPGMTFEDTTRMTERDPADEDRVVLRGTATRRVAIVDASSDAWPFGARTGRAVMAELRVKVGPAEAVRRTAVLLAAPGDARGVWGDEFVDYGVRVLGLPITRERKLIVAE